MRAVICKQHGMADKLGLATDWPEPELGEHDLLIAVKAAALNFPDVLMMQGKYQVQPDLPFVTGGECSGLVSAVGDKVSRFKVGDKVIAVPGLGAFAEKVAAPEATTLPMPEGLNFAQAAGIGVTYFTSYHALKQRAMLQPGETLLVLGAAGGVGSTAVELGKAMGARVIAAASSAEKLQLCQQQGADELLNYGEEGFDLKSALKELSGGRGVDVVYDPVGGDLTEAALRSMAWKGRYIVIGFAAGEIPRPPLNLTLLKGCAIIGAYWGRFAREEPKVQEANVSELWTLFAAGKLSPVVKDLFPLEQYEEAYNCMIQRRARGKVILTTEG